MHKRYSRFHQRIVVAAVLAALVASTYFLFGDRLGIEYLAQYESQLRQWRTASPLVCLTVAFLLYVALTGFGIPGAAILTLVYGWLFGFPTGLILVSFASSIGATFAFLLSRFVFRDFVTKKMGNQASKFEERIKRDGPYFLFALRLIPIMPFFVVNLAMGITPIRVRTYYWVSQLGMLPGTIVYVYAGSTIPDLKTLANEGASGLLKTELLAAFVLLGLFPWLVKRFLGPSLATPQEETPTESRE